MEGIAAIVGWFESTGSLSNFNYTESSMALKEHIPNTTIDLSLEEGNVFNLISIAIRLSKKFELDGKAITKEMIASDYRNAVYVFNREFGHFIDIILPKGMTAQSVKDSYLKTNNTEQNMQEVYLK